MALSRDQLDELARRALEGNRAAMQESFVALIPRLYHQFHNLMNDRPLTEAALRATWDSLVAHLLMRPHEQFSSLLRAIAFSCLRDLGCATTSENQPPHRDDLFLFQDQVEPLEELPDDVRSRVYRHMLVSPPASAMEMILPFVAATSRLRTLTVMFTDMVGSTAYAEKHGAKSLLDKLRRHNEVLQPLIGQNHGRLIRMRGDGSLSTFERAGDAARCAIAVQRHLAAYNADTSNPDLDLDDGEIHVRIGMDHGKVLEFWDRDRLDLVGRTVNTAARVEGSGRNQLDQILVSLAVVDELDPDEFATTELRRIKAEGIGWLTLHRLHWKEDEMLMRARRPAVVKGRGSVRTRGAIAAPWSGGSSSSAATEAGEIRAIHCAFIDPRTERGRIVPVQVRVSDGLRISTLAVTAHGRAALPAEEEAVRSALAILDRIGLGGSRVSGRVVDWWIDDTDQPPEGTPVCTAIALATVAACTGIDIDPAVLVSDDVAGDRAAPSTRIGGKWASIRSSGQFHTLVVPSGHRAEFPDVAHGDPSLRIIEAPNVEAAVTDILGPALGLTTMQLGALLGPDQLRPQIWTQSAGESLPQGDPSDGRDKEGLVHSWRVGDQIRVCTMASRDCHLAAIHIGSAGIMTILFPSANQPSTVTRAHQVVSFPDERAPFHYVLSGPPGWQRLIALATAVPLPLPSATTHTDPSSPPSELASDLRSSGKVEESRSVTPLGIDSEGRLVCARVTTRELVTILNELKERLIGSHEIEFYVSEYEESAGGIRSRGSAAAHLPSTPRGSVISRVDAAGFLSMDLA
jgi:class 3 adenylate cyclase